MVVMGQAKVPTDVPLLAVGFSAGSSLVATYLGKQGEASLVDCAVLVSPGFDMEAAFDTLHPVADAYVTKLAKDLWLLGQNEPVLRQCPAFEALLSARSMKEWHDHMYMVTGHGSRHEYFEDHNPAHRLQDICKPILYINSLDVSEYRFRLPSWCPAASPHDPCLTPAMIDGWYASVGLHVPRGTRAAVGRAPFEALPPDRCRANTHRRWVKEA